jgi:hypothetical protein
MMEAARTSETLVNFYQTARRYNPEDSHLSSEMFSATFKDFFFLAQEMAVSGTVIMKHKNVYPGGFYLCSQTL